MKTKITFLTIFFLFLSSHIMVFSDLIGFSDNSSTVFSSLDMNSTCSDYSKALNINPISFSEEVRGVQKFAVICVEPSDFGNHRWTIPEVENLMETINLFYQDISYGEISIDYDVYGFYDLGYNWDHFGGIDTSGSFDELIVDSYGSVIYRAIVVADADIDYHDYEYVIVFINVAWWRGMASIGRTKIFYTLSEGFFRLGITLCGENAASSYSRTWGRVAHEIGHMFSLEHTHGSNKDGTKNYASLYSLMASAYPSALNFYSHNSNPAIQWFPRQTNMEVVNIGDSDTYYVRPRFIDTVGELQALKIRISNSKYYMVEVIDQTGEDSWLSDEGVLIYKVNRNEPDDDECTDQDSTPGSHANARDDLEDCLYKVGDSLTDLANGITITIDSSDINGYYISVINAGQETSDLHITPWGKPPFETPDIWCDSPTNGYDNYRHIEGRGNPIGTSEEPLLNDPMNRLYARIHNNGGVSVNDAVVKFYHKQPLGAGYGETTWSFIGQRTIDVPHGDFRTCWVYWHPQHAVPLLPATRTIMSLHSCVKVVIEQDVSEEDTWNNEAMENIDFFEIITTKEIPVQMKASINFNPVTEEYTIYNPFKETMNLYFSALGLTRDWNLSGIPIGEFVEFGPNEIKEYDITLTPSSAVTFKDKTEVQVIICYTQIPDDSETFVGDIHLKPIDGFTITATAQYESALEISGSIVSPTQFTISGSLSFLDDIPTNEMPVDPLDRVVFIKAIDTNDNEHFYNATIIVDEEGNFETTLSVKKGVYKVNAYYAGLEFITSSASDTLIIDLETNSVWTSSRLGLFPGFNLFITFGSIIIIASVIKLAHRKTGSKH